ncbi:asp domain containing protein [Stylonychia lemnae]|uniref:Asp domain containing protein n=1 Tax=Stylonychia lemnae TaxID=5949 RepID=A0A078AMG8_STYLE|nr:asp domain containing protein [Stylonychia lemnae]|eukprot:CDW82048.1 asp domain containing protein [Stylonychia lemnae]
MEEKNVEVIPKKTIKIELQKVHDPNKYLRNRVAELNKFQDDDVISSIKLFLSVGIKQAFKILGATFYDQTYSLNNIDNLSYQGSIFMGTERQQLTMIFDTGSSYGSASVAGKYAFDTVSLDSNGNVQATNYKFMAATSVTGFGVISSKIFSFYLSSDSSSISSVEIGGYNPLMIRSGESLVDIPLVKDYFWKSYIEGFRYGETEKSASNEIRAYSTSQVEAIFDTGTSLIYPPTKIYEKLLSIITQNHPEHYVKNGIHYGTCDLSTYESIFLYIDSKYFEITPKSFVFDYLHDQSICAIGIVDGGNFWLLGDVFLREYYSIHDDEANRFKLAPHVYSSARIIQSIKPQSLLSIGDSSDATQIYKVIFVVVLCIVLLLGYGAYIKFLKPLIDKETYAKFNQLEHSLNDKAKSLVIRIKV